MEELLKQLINKIDNMDNKINSIDGKFNNLEERFDKLEEKQDEIINIQTRMENGMVEKFGALFDAREVQNDINVKIFESLDRIEAKVEVLQLETASIRRIK